MSNGRFAALPPIKVELRPRRVLLSVFIACVLAEIIFFLLDWHVNYGRLIDISPIRNMVNTTREDAIASWFGITQTAFVAATLWLLFLTVRIRNGARFTVIGWLILALFFTYMSFDDGSKFHERVGTAYRIMQDRALVAAEEAADELGADAVVEDTVLDMFPSYPWQVVFLPAFGAMGLFMLVFLWREFGARFPRLLLLAGLGCFVIAVGMDFVEGLDEDHPLNVNSMIAELPGVEEYAEERFDRDGYEAVRHFQKSLEETTEMFGMTLLWIAFLRHWMLIVGPVKMTVSPRKPIGGDQRD